MGKVFIVLLAATTLSACLPAIEMGGAGQTKSGNPVAGSLKLDQNTNIFDIAVVSPQGWTCTTQFKKSDTNMQVRTVPLKCNDGRTGTIVMSLNQMQGQAVGSFSLSNGEAGQVTFGNL